MAWTQADRPFRLKTPLGEDVLLLTEWRGEEHVSSWFRFWVTAFSQRGDIGAKDLLLKKVSLELGLPDGSPRVIHGIVSRVTRGGSAPAGFVAYQLEIVPPHWVLGLDAGYHIWQNKSARDVCDALLQGTPFEWKLTRTLDPRPYCFRYAESRWNCIARLLEQEGVWYRYDHRGGDAKLVLHDSVASAQPAWGVTTLRYNELDIAGPRLTSITVDSLAYVAESRVRTASEFLATTDIVNMSRSSGAFTPPAELEAYHFDQQLGAHRTGISHSGGATPRDSGKLPDDTKVQSRLRQELSETLAVVYEGESRYVGLEPGSKCEIVEHPNGSMNGAVFITSVRHSGSNGSYGAGDSSTGSYENSFDAIPAATPFRPARRTPWPHVGGAHVGTVVGPPGDEIYTDKHGRVQVLFKWERFNQQRDESKLLEHSCWVRVAQSFAGQQFGSVFLPRIGHEVLVGFLDGNPDNPVVVGSLYNSANLPPWPLPDNKTQSGIRTKSTLKGGADNHNELRFEDKKGEEQIFVQAEKNLDGVVKNDETRRVLHDRTTTIKNHETRTVEEGNDTTTISKGEQKITVADNNRTLHVEKDHTVSVNGKEAVTVAQDRDVVVQASQTHQVTKDNTFVVKGGHDVTKIETGNSKLEVSMGNIDVAANLGNITIKAGVGSVTVQATQKIELKVGANSIVIDQAGITIKGIMVKVEGQAMVDVKSPMTQVNGTGMVKIQGGVTMIN